MFNTRAALLAFALALPAGAVLASDEVKLTDETQQQIRTTLTEQGYEVRKSDVEDGMYEAYAIKDGKKQEIYLDADMKIVKIKTDD